VVPRSRGFGTLLQHHRTGNIIRVLPGNVGYVDLDRLPAAMVDSAFRMLAGTKAIVLDDRGYPLGTATMAGIRAGHDEVLEAAARFAGGTGEVPPDTMREPAPAPPEALQAERPVSGWRAGGSASASYRLGLDTATAHGGTSSGHITARTAAPEGFAGFAQAIGGGPYLGKRVRFAAYVRSRGVTGGAQIWLRVDGNGGLLAFDNMMNRPVTGTTDWTRVSVVLDVPPDASGLALGFLVRGGGEAWVDDASLEIIGSDVPTTNMMMPSADPTRADTMRREYAAAARALANPGFERP
jgi:hypothetical protein